MDNILVAIDPYLSNAVAESFGRELDRQVTIPLRPSELFSLRWDCLTHAHLDHTDLATLIPLAAAADGREIEIWGDG